MKTRVTGPGNTSRLRSLSLGLRTRLLSHLPFWAAVGWDMRRALVVAAVPPIRDWGKRVFSDRGFFSRLIRRRGA